MSLITEALGLRRSKSAAMAAQETLPPFRTRNLSMQVVSMLVMIAGLTVLGVWQGPALLAWLENFAGVKVPKTAGPAAPVPAPKTAATVPPAIPPPAGPAPEKTAVPAGQKNGSADQPSLLTEVRAEPPAEAAFQPVEVPFVPVARDEDPAQAVERKKNELAAVVRGLQIQGVRLQGRDSRVLINGNPVATGESVGDHGLKLKAVEPSRLIFSDGSGNEYPRSY